jgi:hypothetical protein
MSHAFTRRMPYTSYNFHASPTPADAGPLWHD